MKPTSIELQAQLNIEKRKARFWLRVTLMGVLAAMGVVLFVLSYVYKQHETFHLVLSHVGVVLFSLGIIELFSHIAFAQDFIDEIENHLIPAVGEILDDRIKTAQEIANAGITGWKNVMDVNDFLWLALKRTSDIPVEQRKIRMLVIHINALEDTDQRKGIFKHHVRELINNKWQIEIILPDLECSGIRTELQRRTESGGSSSRIKKLEDTNKELRIFEKEKVIVDAIKDGRWKVLYHDNFISFPLLNFGNVWFQGIYMNGLDAKVNYYVESTLTNGNEIAAKWYTHYKAVRDNIKAKVKGVTAGDFINQLANSDTGQLPFKLGEKYLLSTHAISNEDNNRKHYFSDWVIEITGKERNCYSCILTKKEIASDRTLEPVKGRLFMHKNNSDPDIVFIFDDQDGIIYITGKLNPMSANGFILVYVNYMSSFFHKPLCKMGVLFTQPTSLQALAAPIHQPRPESSPEINQLLLRANKVILETPGSKEYPVYNIDTLRDWTAHKYSSLLGRTGKWDVFYLVVEDVPNKPLNSLLAAQKEAHRHIKESTITIHSNGIVMLERLDKHGIREIYYGDFNKRFEAAIDGVANIKLIRTHRGQNALQDYREIFIMLQWPRIVDAENGKGTVGVPLNYTRGLVLSDRDEGIFDPRRKVIEASRCVIRRQDSYLAPKYHDTDPNKVHEAKLAWASEKLSGVDADFQNWVKDNSYNFKDRFDYYITSELANKSAATNGCLIVQYDRDLCHAQNNE